MPDPKLIIHQQLDDTDSGILALLQKDSRIFHKETAIKLHKSVTAIHNRIRNLESKGYISRYAAIVDHKKIGRGLIAYTKVTLTAHASESLSAFKDEAIKLAEGHGVLPHDRGL